MEAPAHVKEIDSSAGDAGEVTESNVLPLRPIQPKLSDRLSWTYRQRRAMAVLLALSLALILWRTLKNPTFVPDPQSSEPIRAPTLADRLDPNTAPWEELVAIPMLGEKRAQGIVEYRQDWQKRHPGETAFQVPADLAAVK